MSKQYYLKKKSIIYLWIKMESTFPWCAINPQNLNKLQLFIKYFFPCRPALLYTLLCMLAICKKISSSEFFHVMSFIYNTMSSFLFFVLSFIRKSFHIINFRVCQKSKRILSLYTTKYNLTLSTVIEMKMCREYNEKSQCCIRKSDIFSKNVSFKI